MRRRKASERGGTFRRHEWHISKRRVSRQTSSRGAYGGTCTHAQRLVTKVHCVWIKVRTDLDFANYLIVIEGIKSELSSICEIVRRIRQRYRFEMVQKKEKSLDTSTRKTAL